MLTLNKIIAYQEEKEREYNTRFFISSESEELKTVAEWLSQIDADFYRNFSKEYIDPLAVFEDLTLFDELRPIKACTFIWIPRGEKDSSGTNIYMPAIVEFYGEVWQAKEAVKNNDGYFDSCFDKSGPLAMDFIDMSQDAHVFGVEWLTDKNNLFTASRFERFLYV